MGNLIRETSIRKDSHGIRLTHKKKVFFNNGTHERTRFADKKFIRSFVQLLAKPSFTINSSLSLVISQSVSEFSCSGRATHNERASMPSQLIFRTFSRISLISSSRSVISATYLRSHTAQSSSSR